MRRKTHVDALVQTRGDTRDELRNAFRGPEFDLPWRRAEDLPPLRQEDKQPTRPAGRLCTQQDSAAAPAGPAVGPSYHHEDDCVRSKQRPADEVDEASMESFPCSDAPALCRSTDYIPAWEAHQMGL